MKLTRSLLLVLLVVISTTGFSKNKPNVLFIFADDLTHEALGFYGNEDIITPNLDKLAKQGVTFNNAYNMGGYNGAICTASRHMLNTGSTLWRAKEHHQGDKCSQISQQHGMWSQLMKSAGYNTYMTGKWHVSVNADQVFDEASHVRGGMPNQTKSGYNRPLSREDNNWSPYDESKGGFWKGGEHWTEVTANDALGYLDKATKEEDPFFIYCAFNAPHDPRQSPKEYVDLYNPDEIKLPASFMEDYPYRQEIGCGTPDNKPNGDFWTILRDERLAPLPRTEYSIRVNLAEYYAIITHLDAQIGRILDKLKETGEDKNTYIVFASDQGLSVGRHSFLGKQNMYEHSMRLPLVIAGPKLPKNKVREQLLYYQDIVPTILELTGQDIPDHIEFNSLVPQLKSKKAASSYDYIYGAYIEHQRMVRSEDFKLIYYPKADVYRLFDLANDPDELNDLILEPAYKDKIAELKANLIKSMNQFDDPMSQTAM